MRRRSLLFSVGLVLAACVNAVAQQAYTLERKYKAGDVQTYQVTATGAGTMSVTSNAPEGQQGVAMMPPGDLWVDVKLDMSQEVKSVDPEGVAEIVLRFPSLDASVQFPGMSQDITVQQDHVRLSMNGQVVFDSAAQANQPMAQVFGFLTEGIVMKTDKRGRVLDLPQLGMLANMMPQGFDMKSALSMSTGDLPDHPVRVGDTWDQTQAMPFAGAEGKEAPKLITHYKLEGIESVHGRECAKIHMSMDSGIDTPWKMNMPSGAMLGAPGPAPGGEVTLEKLAANVDGTHYVELATGLPVTTKMKVKLDEHIRQKMTVQQGDQKQDLDFTVKLEGLDLDVEMNLAQ
jgi:hypothetical protein